MCKISRVKWGLRGTDHDDQPICWHLLTPPRGLASDDGTKLFEAFRKLERERIVSKELSSLNKRGHRKVGSRSRIQTRPLQLGRLTERSNEPQQTVR